MSENRTPHPLTDPRPSPLDIEHEQIAEGLRTGRLHYIRYPRTQTRPYVVWFMVGVNLLLFLPNLLAPALFEELMLRFMLYPYGVLREGEVWRLFTSMFMHWSIMHVVVNMLSLYSLGRSLEFMFGWQRFLIVYLLGGLGGSALYLLFDTGGVAAGASGAVFALFGADIVYTYQHRNTFYGNQMRRRLQELGFLLILNLGVSLASPMIALWAHVGGLLGGALLAWFIAPRWQISETVTELENGVKIKDAVDTNPWQLRHFGIVAVYALGLVGLGVLAFFLTQPQAFNFVF